MLTLPPLPSWQAIHPLIVHFPIALLLIAPLFIVVGMFRKGGNGFPFMQMALTLMALGTAGAYLAVSSGEAAQDIAQAVPHARAVLQDHRELAETTLLAFAALTLIYASILFFPGVFKAQPSRITSIALPAIFLLLYATGVVTLANTAHQGGRLVHELGVRAWSAESNHDRHEPGEVSSIQPPL